MRDYVYPGVFFAYFYFFLLFGGAIYFCIRSARHGYWGADSEEAKYRMLQDEDATPEESVLRREEKGSYERE